MKIEDLNKGCAQIRTYRNRRIGDFLKELHLTEGRCTGVPKIHKAMENNGSPPAIFETDEESRYFLTILPIHPKATKKTSFGGPVGAQTHQGGGVLSTKTLPEELKLIIDNVGKRPTIEALRFAIQKLCEWQPLTAQQFGALLKKKDKRHLVRSHLTPMVKKGLLKYAYPEDKNLSNLAYTTGHDPS